MKQKIFKFATLLLLFSTPITFSDSTSFDKDEVNDMTDFFMDNYEWSKEEEDWYLYMVTKNCVDANTIVQTLTAPSDDPDTPPILFQQALQKNLYKRTNPLNVRPLHDLPALHLTTLNYCFGAHELNLTIFYTQMRKAFFTQCSSTIDSYLAIRSSDDFVQELDRLVAALVKLDLLPIAFDIPNVLSLFGNIKLEERRIGGMFGYQRQCDWFTWTLQLPVYYIEHNFYLTPQEQRAIADNPLFKNIEPSDDDDNSVEDFLKQHVVNDLIGLGDLRFQALWNVTETDCVSFTLGLELTFPIATDFKNGIVGAEFEEKPCQPNFDIFDFICLAHDSPNRAKEMGTELGIHALDRLARIAADTHLGGEHFGIGSIIENHCSLTDSFSLFNKLRLHYLVPKTEIRFFRVTKNPSEFDRDYENANLATENLKFLSEQLVNTLYPPAVFTDVSPGIIIEFTTAAHFDCNHIHAEIGYDFWYQGSESIKVDDPRNLWVSFDIAEGKKCSAYQHKVFGKVFWDKAWKCRDWRIGLVADATFANEGIGKDWTVGLDLALRF